MTYFSNSLTFLQNKRFWPYAYSMNNSTLCPVSLARFKTHCACPGIPMICSWVRHCTFASPAWIALNTARTVTELSATVCVAFTDYCDHYAINLSKASQWWSCHEDRSGTVGRFTLMVVKILVSDEVMLWNQHHLPSFMQSFSPESVIHLDPQKESSVPHPQYPCLGGDWLISIAPFQVWG